MSKREPPLVLDMDDLQVKRQFMSKIGTLSGLWEVSLYKRRFQRTNKQNRYYHVAVVAPFREWLREQWGDPEISHEQAHIELKKAVLGVKEKINERTGEIMELVPPSHNKDTWEFTLFLDKCAEFLARFAGIVVLTPDEFYMTEKNLTKEKTHA